MSQQSHHSKSGKRISDENLSVGQNISDILPNMISYVNSFPNGNTSFRNLQKKFNQYSADQLWSFLVNKQTNFLVEIHNESENRKRSGDELIWVNSDLQLCEQHCRKNKNCKGVCGKLHLCRTFLLLGDMCCPYYKAGKVCTFGHDLNASHNRNLLTTHNLISLSEEELRIMFRRRICRSVSTMPQICIYYNGKGCSNKNCRSLHLCLDFVLQKCQGPCRKNHLLSHEQVAYTLDLFAIDRSWEDSAVLNELAKIMKKRVGQSHDGAKSSDITGDPDEGSDTELKAFAGVDDDSDHEIKSECCSHCKEMRSDMKVMTFKMQQLTEGLHHLKSESAEWKNSIMQSKDLDYITDTDTVASCEKKLIAELIYPRISKLQPQLAGQITGMLLETDDTELFQMIATPETLERKVDEIVSLLTSQPK